MEEPFPDEQDEEEDEEWPQGGRVIVHIDLDCFYAQVETLRNPELRGKPLGIQQKSIVVTCNYEARKFGVGKLTSVKEAKEKCPELVLVNGEDLTPYREMSYKVTELLGEFCPLVERLGLDENFLDITELVEKKFRELEENSQIPVWGNVCGEEAPDFQNPSHIRLLLGSGIAREFRDLLKSRLGLSACAGIAAGKSVAKILSGMFKPDQQTLLLGNSREFLAELGEIHKIPGIGSKTRERLAKLGVKTIGELQEFPIFLLEKEFGIPAATKIHKLSLGQENSQIIPWKLPQSLSDEDSFPKISTESEIREKIRELLQKLLQRLSRDGRRPRTLRLGIRKFPGKENSQREFRQCPVPGNIDFGAEISDLLPNLVEISMKLFRKMVPGRFQVNLLSVGFAKLEKTQRGNIEGFLKRKVQDEENSDSKAPKIRKIPEKKGEKNSAEKSPPEFVDPEVFWELPPEIREEIRDWGRQNSREKSSGKGKNLGKGSQSSLLEYLEFSGKKLG